MANPFPNRFDSECQECECELLEGDTVFADDGNFICEDCAEGREIICECGNYKKKQYSTCFDCK